MADLKIKAGSTSKKIQVMVRNNSAVAGEGGLTGLAFDTANLRAYYFLNGAATGTAIALASGTVGTWSSGGFKQIDATNMPGLYELGVPDLALTGATAVTIQLGGATNMGETIYTIELDAVNYQDAVHFGLSALPNAAAGANTGLPLGDAAGAVTLAAVTHTGAVLPRVTLTDTATALTGKTGFALSATGLDSIAVTDVSSDSDARSTFPKMVRALFNRFYNAVTQTASTEIVKSDAGSAISTMAISDDGTTFTKAKSA